MVKKTSEEIAHLLTSSWQHDVSLDSTSIFVFSEIRNITKGLNISLGTIMKNDEGQFITNKVEMIRSSRNHF